MSLTKRPAPDDDINRNVSIKNFKKQISSYAAHSTTKDPQASTGKMPIKTEDDDQAGPIVTRNVLMWFRNDLRIHDNRALYAASIRSKVGGNNSFLIALYIVSEEEWSEHDEAPVKIDFWMRNLVTLKASLDNLAIPLIVKKAPKKSDVIKTVEDVVQEMDISHVFWSSELMVDEKKRDHQVKLKLLKNRGVYVEEHENQVIVPTEDVRTKTGNPYTVFTPFYNTWCKLVETEAHYLEITEGPDANPSKAKEIYADYFKVQPPSFYPHSLDADEMKRRYPAGEDEAHARLKKFIQEKGKRYHQGRDVPCQEDTSILSPYLNAGVLSTRQCVVAAMAANKNKILSGDEGLKTWIKELGWRVRMRQLKETGYMHNRLRMIVACFLVKDLLINWQKGEKYFMNNLIDGDLASNNGGWQWSASTGTDAQPYFRVFNPLLQSKRYDPKGEYIRRWVPELESLTDQQIHDPSQALSANEFAKLGVHELTIAVLYGWGMTDGHSYPMPIVDHAMAKAKYLEEFKRALALS
ncbi:hypothetical protein FBU30_003210 [Linnemannia zychae]|nr:hypothetical protein FBU30_003210 [Linnemannia zychae]